MARKPQSRGICTFCGKEYSKGGMTRHLKTCKAREQAIIQANKKFGRNTTLYHLQILDDTRWAVVDPSHFWLHLEIKSNATLDTLDQYLRAIWLECCGHLSGFEIGPVFYTKLFDDGMGWREERSMAVPVGKLFRPGMEIPYEYDFGTTSSLIIRVLDERKGKPIEEKPIVLMARNNPPDIRCAVCGEPAQWICTQCAWEEDKNAFFCDKHANQHEHRNMLLPVVNSPRMGLCAYSGPAEPPY